MMGVHNRLLHLALGIGLVQGLLFWLLLNLAETASDWRPALAGVACAVSVGGLTLQLLGEQVRNRIALLLTLALSVLIGTLSAWSLRLDDTGLLLAWFFFAALIAYIGIAFILAWPSREQGRLRYADLFRHAWNNGFILFFAQLLVGVFSSLLGLWALLFGMLGIDFFGELFGSQGFMSVSGALVFAVGVRMACSNERVIGLLRGLLLTLCRFLLPLAALIVVLFVLALPFTGLQAIWQTGHANAILLSLLLATLLLVNGVFQDGSESIVYPRPLRRLAEAALLGLPVLAGLAAYSLYLRIEQYGLTPQRYYAVLLVLMALLYALAFCWALRPGQAGWLASLRQTNPPLALLLLALLSLAQLPGLDAQESSARSQVARLLDGRVSAEHFDAYYLRHELGEPGRRQFATLQARLHRGELFAAEQRQLLLASMDKADAESRGDYRLAKADAMQPETLDWIGPAEDKADAVVEERLRKEECGYAGCLLWAVDLDQDGRNEVLLLPTEHYGASLTFLARDPQGRWHRAGSFEQIYDTDELIAAIRAGEVTLTPPRYRSLQFAQQLYVPVPERN